MTNQKEIFNKEVNNLNNKEETKNRMMRKKRKINIKIKTSINKSMEMNKNLYNNNSNNSIKNRGSTHFNKRERFLLNNHKEVIKLKLPILKKSKLPKISWGTYMILQFNKLFNKANKQIIPKIKIKNKNKKDFNTKDLWRNMNKQQEKYKQILEIKKQINEY